MGNNNSTDATGQDSRSNPLSLKPKNKLKLDAFPNVLHRILSKEENAEIITWLPHGCSWKITHKSRFVDEVIPKFFNHKNFKSFLRQVNGWGFMRINKGPDEGSYYHKSFLRGEPTLARAITRPSDFKATCNAGEDPPNFRLLHEQKTNRCPNGLAQLVSIELSQPLPWLNFNHSMSQTTHAIEGGMLDASAVLADQHVLQTNISQVVPISYVPQSTNSSALMCLLLERRQREIKAMLCLEEIKRSYFSSLLSHSRIANFNPILRQGSATRLPPNS